MHSMPLRMLVLSMTVVSLGAADRYTVHRETTATKTLRFAGAGVRTIDIRANSGAVHVSGAAGPDVEIEARTIISAEDAEAAADAERRVSLDTKEDGATVEAVVREDGRAACGESEGHRPDAWWDRRHYQASVDLTIRVPAATRVRLCTVNSHDVHVEGTSGDFDIQNVNGAIVLDDVRGAGRAATVNGRVEATFAGPPRAESLFKTVNGEIAVTLPADTAADLRLKTQHGGVFTDFDVVAQPAPAMPSKEFTNGRYVYRFDGHSAFRIGRGGPALTLETLNGDVRVRRAQR